MRIVAVIQARMGSTRLPGKVLRHILDKPMLWYIVERLRSIPEIAKITVATSDRKADDQIAHFCQSQGIDCFRGSETDVLGRFYRAAKNGISKNENSNAPPEAVVRITGDCPHSPTLHSPLSKLSNTPEAVIRITGDCPLIDPRLVRRLLLKFTESGDLDHIGLAAGAGVADQGFRQGRFPDGLDAEVIRFEALERAWMEAKDPLEREHVTPFIWKHPERFRLACLSSEKDYSSMRWTVDNPEDLEFVNDIYRALYKKNPCFGLEDILGYLKDQPGLMEKNARFVGYEGYEVFWAE